MIRWDFGGYRNQVAIPDLFASMPWPSGVRGWWRSGCPQKAALALVGLFFDFLWFSRGERRRFYFHPGASGFLFTVPPGILPAPAVGLSLHPPSPPGMSPSCPPKMSPGVAVSRQSSGASQEPAPPAPSTSSGPMAELGHRRDVLNPWIKLGFSSALPAASLVLGGV